VVRSYCDNMCDVRMHARITQSIAATYHLLFQVCKNPEKTKKKKEALSPAETMSSHIGHLQVSPGNDDDYPVPQVRASRAPLEPTRFSDGWLKPNLKQARKPSSEDNDTAGALPRVASSSTVLAPIGTKTNYIGPTLLRSRHIGLKRSGSSEIPGDGSDKLKKPRSGYSAPHSHGLRHFAAVTVNSPTLLTVKRTAQFRVPFKVPFNTASEHPRATTTDNEPIRDEAKPLRDSDGAGEEAVIDLADQSDEALPCRSDF
jgi:hypothetical protein